jgi:hypothetical protein
MIKRTKHSWEKFSNKFWQDQLYWQSFHSHAAMTSSLECVHRWRSHCNMFALLFKLINAAPI